MSKEIFSTIFFLKNKLKLIESKKFQTRNIFLSAKHIIIMIQCHRTHHQDGFKKSDMQFFEKRSSYWLTTHQNVRFKKNTPVQIFKKSTRFDGLPSNYIKSEQMLNRKCVTHRVIEFYVLNMMISIELQVQEFFLTFNFSKFFIGF